MVLCHHAPCKPQARHILVPASRDIGITQKTAWRMLHLIRTSVSFKNGGFLSDNVEIDETFVGGMNSNRHRDKKVKNSQGRSFMDKVPMFGMHQR